MYHVSRLIVLLTFRYHSHINEIFIVIIATNNAFYRTCFVE